MTNTSLSKRETCETPRAASRPWTVADDDQLKELAVSGASLLTMGQRLKRTEAAIRARAYFLDIPLRRVGIRRRATFK
jgi:hypothetical protein